MVDAIPGRGGREAADHTGGWWLVCGFADVVSLRTVAGLMIRTMRALCVGWVLVE